MPPNAVIARPPGFLPPSIPFGGPFGSGGVGRALVVVRLLVFAGDDVRRVLDCLGDVREVLVFGGGAREEVTEGDEDDGLPEPPDTGDLGCAEDLDVAEPTPDMTGVDVTAGVRDVLETMDPDDPVATSAIVLVVESTREGVDVLLADWDVDTDEPIVAVALAIEVSGAVDMLGFEELSVVGDEGDGATGFVGEFGTDGVGSPTLLVEETVGSGGEAGIVPFAAPAVAMVSSPIVEVVKVKVLVPQDTVILETAALPVGIGVWGT